MNADEVAKAIHDEPIQVLAATLLRLQLLARKIDDPDTKSLAESTVDGVDRALLSLRDIMTSLQNETTSS